MRTERLNATIRSILAELLPTLKDPRIGFVTITEVRASADLSHAQVFYTSLPDDEPAATDTAAGLRSAAPLLRRALGARLRVRQVPELRFTHDPVPGQGRRIAELLEQTRRARPAPNAERRM